MKISLIICTYNRCQILGRTLSSVANSELVPSVTWEVVVVDNNSTDATKKIVEEFCLGHPGRFRYVFESEPGKSHALNSGVRAATGDILAFTDDDVIVGRTWLQNLTAPLKHGNYAGVGGPTLLEPGFTPPKWLAVNDRHSLAPLAGFSPARAAGPLKEGLIGANMAFLRRVFSKYGGFRTDLGPQADTRQPQKAEDSEFCQRLLAAGETLFYEPSAVVHHPVPEVRLTRKYFLAWWYDKGRSEIRAFGIPGDTQFFLAGIPAYYFRRLVSSALRWAFAISRSRRFSNRVQLWYVAGAISGCLSQHRQSATELRRLQN